MTVLSLAPILFALGLLVVAWLFRRGIFIYPSTWILLLSTALYMLPAMLFAEEVAELSPYAVTALQYCSVFVVVGLLMRLASRPPALQRVLGPPPAPGRAQDAVARALPRVLLVLGVITFWYLLHVPLRSTGLYGVLFDPANANQLREESLKLLDSPALQYVYLIGFSALSPLAFTLLLSRAAELAGGRRWRLVLPVSLFLAFYLLLTGARVGLANLAVAGVMYALMRQRMTFQLKPFLMAVAIVLAVPMLLSFLREQGRNEATVLEYAEAIGERIFLLPLLISGWFVEYADTHGRVGLMAAIGLGEKVNWSNVIALEFIGRREAVTVETVTTPTAFVFSNYLYFGWLGLLPSWIALRLIDMPADWARRAPASMRVPLLAALCFFAVIYVQSGFGVATISHGYVVLAAIAWFAAQRRRRSPTAAPAGAARAPIASPSNPLTE